MQKSFNKVFFGYIPLLELLDMSKISGSLSVSRSCSNKLAGPSGNGIVWCSLSHGLSLDYIRDVNYFNLLQIGHKSLNSFHLDTQL